MTEIQVLRPFVSSNSVFLTRHVLFYDRDTGIETKSFLTEVTFLANVLFYDRDTGIETLLSFQVFARRFYVLFYDRDTGIETSLVIIAI